jgi:DNA-binding transcriptional LysR family regulator
LRLGLYKMNLRQRVVEMMHLFDKNFPEVEVTLKEFDTPQQVQEALLEENIDLGFTLEPLKYEALSAKVIKKGYLKVILPLQHPRAQEESLTLSSLHNEKWIEISRQWHPMYEEIEKICQSAGFSRSGKIVQEVSSLELLVSMVEVGKGIAFISSAYDLSRDPNVALRRLVNPDGSPLRALEITNALAWKNPGSPLLRAFLAAIEA